MKHSIEYLASFLTEDPDIYVRNARLIHEAGEVMDEAPRPRKPRAKKGEPAQPEGWKEGSWAAKQAAAKNAAPAAAPATPAAAPAKKPRKPRAKKDPTAGKRPTSGDPTPAYYAPSSEKRVEAFPAPTDGPRAPQTNEPLTKQEFDAGTKKLDDRIAAVKKELGQGKEPDKLLTPDEIEELLSGMERTPPKVNNLDGLKPATPETPDVNGMSDDEFDKFARINDPDPISEPKPERYPLRADGRPDIQNMTADQFENYIEDRPLPATDIRGKEGREYLLSQKRKKEAASQQPPEDDSWLTPLDDPKDTPVDADIVDKDTPIDAPTSHTGDDPTTAAKRALIRKVKGQFDFDAALKILRQSGVNATPAKLINQVNKHGIDSLVKFMAKRGVFRNLVNTAAQDPIKRAQMTRQFIKQMADNPQLEKWFVDQIVADRNFGIMAERSLDDKAKEEYVTGLLKTKPQTNHGIPHRTGPLPRRV